MRTKPPPGAAGCAATAGSPAPIFRPRSRRGCTSGCGARSGVGEHRRACARGRRAAFHRALHTRRSLWRASLRGETRLGAMMLTPALDLAAMRETIPDHLAHDAWHSVAIGAARSSRGAARCRRRRLYPRPGPEAPIFSLRPEWSASLVPEGPEPAARRAGARARAALGPGARWLHDISLRHDAAGRRTGDRHQPVVLARVLTGRGGAPLSPAAGRARDAAPPRR